VRIADLPSAQARVCKLRMQMIFQDPYASLNPRMRVVDIVGEAPVVHGIVAPHQKVEYVGLQLNRVGLDPTLMRRFPHQFSGGQRARIGIARALAVRPEFLVCDEPTSALDVSVQAQVLNIMKRLQRQHGLTYLFISHNLAVVEHIASEVAVMYLGRIVERAESERLREKQATAEWVSVETRLPNEGDWLLHTYAGVRIPEYGLFRGGRFWRGDVESLPATHWMAVPTIELGVA
jgi:peptide/nickel transport system ATP-binding protein